jgi:hypothetical protein
VLPVAGDCSPAARELHFANVSGPSSQGVGQFIAKRKCEKKNFLKSKRASADVDFLLFFDEWRTAARAQPWKRWQMLLRG